MQISCPKCLKKFEVNADLIPKKGREVQCGSCEFKWFYNINITPQHKKIIETKKTPKIKKIQVKVQQKVFDDLDVNDKNTNISNKHKLEKKTISKKYKEKKTNYFKSLLVLIISFVAILIVIETFKNQISIFYPNINLILENLYESLKDINLFLKDLFN